jgi:Ca2+-binding EF-hand superfamily protein
MRHEAILDRDFLYGHDYKVPLTKAQNDHYALIFKLNDATDTGSLQVEQLSRYMYSLGHGVSVEELEEMMHDVGIDEDNTGAITEADFLEFMRRENVANLPSKKIPHLERLFERYHAEWVAAAEKAKVAESGVDVEVEDDETHHMRILSETMTKQDKETEDADGMHHIPRDFTMKLMHEIGFELDEHTFAEVFEEVDSRADGTVTLPELITALGMLKRNILEVMQLERAFVGIRKGRKKKEKTSPSKASPTPKRRMLPSPWLTASPSKESEVEEEPEEELDEHLVYASDLVRRLGVNQNEAEEMIFIADLQDNQSIDFTEFKQIVVNWS